VVVLIFSLFYSVLHAGAHIFCRTCIEGVLRSAPGADR
jgi:hypothetical protein